MEEKFEILVGIEFLCPLDANKSCQTSCNVSMSCEMIIEQSMKYVPISEDPQSLVFVTPLNLPDIIGFLITGILICKKTNTALLNNRAIKQPIEKYESLNIL